MSGRIWKALSGPSIIQSITHFSACHCLPQIIAMSQNVCGLSCPTSYFQLCCLSVYLDNDSDNSQSQWLHYTHCLFVSSQCLSIFIHFFLPNYVSNFKLAPLSFHKVLNALLSNRQEGHTLMFIGWQHLISYFLGAFKLLIVFQASETNICSHRNIKWLSCFLLKR